MLSRKFSIQKVDQMSPSPKVRKSSIHLFTSDKKLTSPKHDVLLQNSLFMNQMATMFPLDLGNSNAESLQNISNQQSQIHAIRNQLMNFKLQVAGVKHPKEDQEEERRSPKQKRRIPKVSAHSKNIQKSVSRHDSNYRHSNTSMADDDSQDLSENQSNASGSQDEEMKVNDLCANITIGPLSLKERQDKIMKFIFKKRVKTNAKKFTYECRK